ncbi:MAG: outer membrane beta-barrel protein [Marinilabilia sp.]
MRPIILAIILLLSVSAPLLSQEREKKKVPNLPAFDYQPLHFGFLIGLNTMDFRVVHKAHEDRPSGTQDRYAEVVNLNPGINIGIVSSLRLNKYLNLRFLPGISFGQRDLWFIDSGERESGPLEIKSTFLEFPLLLKFNGARMTNVKPYLIGGINPRVDLAKSENDGMNLRSSDLYLEVGTGLDMYLNYFRLSAEAKLSVGMRNVLDPSGTGEPEDEMYTDVLDRLTSRLFVFTFYFE